jgi:hypothetical protein
MRRHCLAFALAALPCALLLSLPLPAQQVYKWKDANGVTQYSATPPPEGRTYETRQVDRHVAVPASQAQDATGDDAPPEKQPAEDPACATARSNLVLLKGKAAITIDSNGDGKPDKPLADADRAKQLALAQATIDVKCTQAASAPEQAAEPEEQ